MELNKESRDRIFAAADQLYDEAGRVDFPPVVEVRKLAKANMNDTTAAMKEWRRLQTSQAAPVAVQVPEAVQQASGNALIALWQAAQELANESLRAAQAGWEKERAESDTVGQQISDAYDAQTLELDAALRQIEELTQAHQQEQQKNLSLTAQLDENKRALDVMTASAEQATARAIEIERRADDLHGELTHAHRATADIQAELGVTRAELATVKQKADEAKESSGRVIERLRDELATVKAHSESNKESHQNFRQSAALEATKAAEAFAAMQDERNQVRKELDTQRDMTATAREDAATQRGQVTVLLAQLKELQGRGKKDTKTT